MLNKKTLLKNILTSASTLAITMTAVDAMAAGTLLEQIQSIKLKTPTVATRSANVSPIQAAMSARRAFMNEGEDVNSDDSDDEDYSDDEGYFPPAPQLPIDTIESDEEYEDNAWDDEDYSDDEDNASEYGDEDAATGQLDQMTDSLRETLNHRAALLDAGHTAENASAIALEAARLINSGHSQEAADAMAYNAVYYPVVGSDEVEFVAPDGADDLVAREFANNADFDLLPPPPEEVAADEVEFVAPDGADDLVAREFANNADFDLLPPPPEEVAADEVEFVAPDGADDLVAREFANNADFDLLPPPPEEVAADEVFKAVDAAPVPAAANLADILFAAPAVEVAAPAVEVAAPAVEVAAPAVEVAAPAVEVATPAVEVATPAVEVATPAVEVATPTKVAKQNKTKTYTDKSDHATEALHSAFNMVAQRTVALSRITHAATAETGIAAGSSLEKFGVWGQAMGGVANQKARKGAAGFKSNIVGGMIGADTMINDNTILGLSFGNVINNVKSKDGDKTRSLSLVATAYGNYKFDNDFFIRGAAAYSNTAVDNKDKRGTVVARGKYHINSFGGEVAVGKIFTLPNDVLVTPSIGARFTRTGKISYKEKGGAGFDYPVLQKASNSAMGIVGLQVAKAFAVNDFTITPELHANVAYGLGVKAPAGKFTSTAGTTTSYRGDKPSRFDSTVGFGITAESGSFEYGVAYDANISAGYLGHQGSLKLKVKF